MATTEPEIVSDKVHELLDEATTLFEIRGCIRTFLVESDAKRRFLRALTGVAERDINEALRLRK